MNVVQAVTETQNSWISAELSLSCKIASDGTYTWTPSVPLNKNIHWSVANTTIVHRPLSHDQCQNQWRTGVLTLPTPSHAHSATAGAPGTTRPQALWFMGPNSCLIGNFVISQWVCVLAIIPIQLFYATYLDVALLSEYYVWNIIRVFCRQCGVQ